MQQVLGVRGGTLRAQRGKGHLGPPKGLASGHQDRTGGAGAGDDSRSESQMIGQKDRGTGAGGDPLGACSWASCGQRWEGLKARSVTWWLLSLALASWCLFLPEA